MAPVITESRRPTPSLAGHDALRTGIACGAPLTEQAARADGRRDEPRTVREQAGPLTEAVLFDRVAHRAYVAELLSAELDDREGWRRASLVPSGCTTLSACQEEVCRKEYRKLRPRCPAGGFQQHKAILQRNDKVHRRDVVERAWELVRRNRGAAGIDGVTLAEVERYGVERLLDELAAELKEKSYRVQPSRRVWIAKPGRTEKRPLSIPAVRDRIVQAELKLVMEPVFEADFLSCSFGFRPKRTAHDALQVLINETALGRRWVVETDIASCFEAIPHDRLMAAVEERICDRHLLKLVRATLRAGVMESGVVRHNVTGTPQGGVMSPLLANVYLHRLARAWEREGRGVLVRYADDLVVLCRSREEAERALVLLGQLLGELGLELKAEKTRIVHLTEGDEGLDFLGFEHRWVRARRGTGRYLLRQPSRGAMQRARDRICELTERRRLRERPERIVAQVNGYLRGWAGYFVMAIRRSGSVRFTIMPRGDSFCGRGSCVAGVSATG